MPIEVLDPLTALLGAKRKKNPWHVWQHKEDSVNALLCNWSDAPFAKSWNYILTPVY